MLRWEDNIKITSEVAYEGVGWTYAGQNRDLQRALVNTVMNLRIP